jgi:hypothetical protein
VAAALGTKFKWQVVSLGKILKDEVAKKSQHADVISKALNA